MVLTVADKGWIAAHLPESVTVVLGAVGAWWTQRGAKLRALGRRVTALERDQIARHQELKNEMSEMRESFTSSLVNEHGMIVGEIDKRFGDMQKTQQLILDKLIPGAGDR